MGMNCLKDHIFAVAKRDNLDVTNLQLQKVMYFAIKDYLEKNPSFEKDNFIRSVYDEPFETWPYGPVIPDIYHEYSIYGSLPIPSDGEYRQEYSVFDEAIVALLKEDVFILVEKSHQQPIWKNHKRQILMHNGLHRYELGDIID